MFIVGFRFWFCVLLLAFARPAVPADAAAAPTDLVTLGWVPSPDVRVVGYLLLCGTTSGVYTNQLAVGNTNRATVTGLRTNVTYYFTVVAHDATGQQSPPSNEIAYTVPANSAASCLPAPAGLVAWWRGDGDTDDVVGGNRGTLQGGATASAVGEVGQAFSFDGTNGFVQIPDSPALRPTNFTVEAWVRFSSLDSAGNSPSGQQYIIFKQNTRSGDFEGYYLGKQRLAGADTFHFAVSSSAGQLADTASSTLVQNGVWYHVAAVRGSNFIQLYVNGRLECQASVSFPQDYGNLPLYFGSSGQSYWDRKFAGSLDEVSLYNRALSANEIAATCLAGAAGKCKGAGSLAITAQPQSQSAPVGNNVSFTVAASGTAPLSYQWRKGGNPLSNGGNVSGANGPVLSLANVQAVYSGAYEVVVANNGGSVTSAVATLTVNLRPAITTQPASRSVPAGGAATFTVTATSTAPLSYQWLFNGARLADGGQFGGATTATLTIASVQAANAGGYSVVVANVAGSVTSVVAVLTLSGGSATTPAGRAGWWPGDGNANDVVGGHNGTLQGGATASAAGEVGQAFSFDGTSGYVQIPDSPSLRPTNLTIAAWVRFRSLDSAGSGGSPAGDQYIVFRQNSRSGDFEGFDLSKTRVAGGDVFRFVVTSEAGQVVELHSTTLVSVGVWYHVAGVRGSNFTQLYVNGHQESQASVSFPQNYGTLPLYFGTSGQSYWDHKLNGALDEVSLYNRALSANEISAIYAAGSGGKSKAASMGRVTALRGDQLSFTLEGELGRAYAIEVSPDLEHWFQFEAVTLSDSAVEVIVPATQPRQFYRASLLP